MLQKINQNILIISLLLLFILLCWHQTGFLNLWGDEASSLALAEKSIKTILAVTDVHAPTYYILLKSIIGFTGSAYIDEAYIRLIHVFAFCIGLYFGCRILKLIFNDDVLIFYTLLFAIVSPSMLFYATNIRMYAFLFCFLMWFIYSIVIFFRQKNTFNLKENWPILAAGFLLVSLDYIGFFYYAIGSIFILLRTRSWRITTLLAAPPLLVLIFYAPLLLPSVKLLFSWQAHGVDTTTLTTKIFNAVRPFIELTNISYQQILIPLAYLVLYGAFLLVGTLYFMGKEKTLENLLFLSFAFLWLITACIGCSITRLFLVSQFFMSALIIYAIIKTPILKRFSGIIVITLILFNLMLALYPLPKFASSIPYRDIAMNTVEKANQFQINTIVLANNSENVYSIERYLLQANPKLTIIKIKDDFTQNEIPLKPFLFISYMPENNRFVDPSRFTIELHRPIRKIANYVALNELPFNSFWNWHILSKANASFAYKVYKVLPASAQNELF